MLIAEADFPNSAVFARAVHLDAAAMWRYVNGRLPCLPRARNVIRMANALGVRYADVIAAIRESRRRYVEWLGPQVAADEAVRQAALDRIRDARYDAPGRSRYGDDA